MEILKVKVTSALKRAIESLATEKGQSTAEIVEDTLWRSTAVKSAASAIGVEKSKRRQRGERGKGVKNIEPS